MKRWIVACIGCALAVAQTQAQELIHLTVTGAVAHPGSKVFTGAPRLADAVKAAQVHRDAYIAGAALMRSELLPAQTRVKAGLLFDLGIIERLSTSNEREPAGALAHRVRAQVDAMPITGRKIVHTLEPHALQSSAADNLPLKDNDGLFYPLRPGTVRVVGAVDHDCDLPHVGMRDVLGYLAQCPASRFADPDIAYVIEPDGVVSVRGIALWNRSPPIPVAPGAVLYVPFGHKATAGLSDPDFNRDMADFIATQPLGGAGVGP
ncbi:MAG TPA: capsule biosynthesis GfcC family protein [Xanthomonadaceae bacterium]|jgi:hypothetical protein